MREGIIMDPQYLVNLFLMQDSQYLLYMLYIALLCLLRSTSSPEPTLNLDLLDARILWNGPWQRREWLTPWSGLSWRRSSRWPKSSMQPRKDQSGQIRRFAVFDFTFVIFMLLLNRACKVFFIHTVWPMILQKDLNYSVQHFQDFRCVSSICDVPQLISYLAILGVPWQQVNGGMAPEPKGFYWTRGGTGAVDLDAMDLTCGLYNLWS